METSSSRSGTYRYTGPNFCYILVAVVLMGLLPNREYPCRRGTCSSSGSCRCCGGEGGSNICNRQHTTQYVHCYGDCQNTSDQITASIHLAHQAFPVAIAVAGECRARAKRPPCVPRLAVVEADRFIPVLRRVEATGGVSVSQFLAQSLVRFCSIPFDIQEVQPGRGKRNGEGIGNDGRWD